MMAAFSGKRCHKRTGMGHLPWRGSSKKDKGEFLREQELICLSRGIGITWAKKKKNFKRMSPEKQ